MKHELFVLLCIFLLAPSLAGETHVNWDEITLLPAIARHFDLQDDYFEHDEIDETENLNFIKSQILKISFKHITGKLGITNKQFAQNVNLQQIKKELQFDDEFIDRILSSFSSEYSLLERLDTISFNLGALNLNSSTLPIEVKCAIKYRYMGKKRRDIVKFLYFPRLDPLVIDSILCHIEYLECNEKMMKKTALNIVFMYIAVAAGAAYCGYDMYYNATPQDSRGLSQIGFYILGINAVASIYVIPQKFGLAKSAREKTLEYKKLFEEYPNKGE